MKSWRKVVLIMGLGLLTGAKAVAQEQGSKHMVFPVAQPGRPVNVEVSLQYGSITVMSYEGKDIVIDANSEVKYPLELDAAGHTKAAAKSHRLNFTVDAGNNSIIVKGSPDDLVNLTIRVPNVPVKLNLKTVNEGNIAVKSVKGNVEATNTNGSILLEHVSGSLIASTTNGSVRASFDHLNPGAPMAITVLDGDVDLTLPRAFSANLQMTTDVGSMYTDFNVAGTEKPPVRDPKTGMWRFPGEQRIRGKIGGGGPEVFLKVLDGSIYLRRQEK